MEENKYVIRSYSRQAGKSLRASMIIALDYVGEHLGKDILIEVVDCRRISELEKRISDLEAENERLLNNNDFFREILDSNSNLW